MWLLVPKFSHQNVTSNQSNTHRSLRNTHRARCLVSSAPCPFLTYCIPLSGPRREVNRYVTNTREGGHQSAHGGGQLCPLWPQHTRCSLSPELPPGVGVELTTLRWAPAPQPWSALNKGQPQGRAWGGHGKARIRTQSGVYRNHRQRQRCFLLCPGNRGFSAPGAVRLEQQLSCAERSGVS